MKNHKSQGAQRLACIDPTTNELSLCSRIFSTTKVDDLGSPPHLENHKLVMSQNHVNILYYVHIQKNLANGSKLEDFRLY